MTDETATDYLTGAIANLLTASDVCRIDITRQDLERAARGILNNLKRPRRRTGLIGWQVESGILRPADMWAVPDPDVELERLPERVKAAKTDAELDALLDEEGLLREAFNRTCPVY